MRALGRHATLLASIALRETELRNPPRIAKRLWDCVGIPFRFLLFDQRWLPVFGWTTLEEARFAAVLPVIEGELLDVGAGPNRLVRQYGHGIGVDVYDWRGGALVVETTAQLPFDGAHFDTVTFVAALNHIPYRLAAVKEAWRLLRPHGKLVITMIGPLIGMVGHLLWWYSEDKQRGGMKPGEVGGLSTAEVAQLCQAAGFHLKSHTTFLYGLNNLYVFEK